MTEQSNTKIDLEEIGCENVIQFEWVLDRIHGFSVAETSVCYKHTLLGSAGVILEHETDNTEKSKGPMGELTT
jgi:hypothetical protein